MKKIRVIVALLLIGFFADYLFLHQLFPKKQKDLLTALNAQVEKALSSTANGSGNAIVSAVSAAMPTDDVHGEINDGELGGGSNVDAADMAVDNFKSELKNCSFEKNFLANNSGELLTELKASNQVQQDQATIKNIHFKNASGESIRLHLLFNDSSNGQTRNGLPSEVRMFKLDAEGLPLPVALPPDKAKNPSAKYLTELQSDGNVQLIHEKRDIRLKDGSEILAEVINGKIRDFQWLQKQSSLNCRHSNCHCRK